MRRNSLLPSKPERISCNNSISATCNLELMFIPQQTQVRYPCLLSLYPCGSLRPGDPAPFVSNQLAQFGGQWTTVDHEAHW